MGYKTICSECGKHKKILKDGKCAECIVIPVQEAIKQLKDKSGPRYLKYRKNLGKVNMQMKKKKGPYYEEWLKGMSKNLNKEIARINKTHTGSQGHSKRIKQVKVKDIRQKKCKQCCAFNPYGTKTCSICGAKF